VICKAARHLGNAALPIFLEHFADQREKVRYVVQTGLVVCLREGLSAKQTEDVLTVAADNLQHRDAKIRRMAFWAFGHLRPFSREDSRRAAETLVAGLKDSDQYVRSTAVWELAHFPTDAELVIPALLDFLDNERVPFLRWYAASSLTTYRNDPRVFEKLIELLRDDNASARSAAAFAIGLLSERGKKAQPAILEALQGTDSNGQSLATSSMLTSLQRIALPPRQAIGVFSKIVVSPTLSYEVRTTAVIELGQIGNGSTEAIAALKIAATMPELSSVAQDALRQLGFDYRPVRSAPVPLQSDREAPPPPEPVAPRKSG
jgi:HEAT repeat protein